MPIKIDIHDNTSQVRARVTGDSGIPVSAGDSINYHKLEIELAHEIEARILGDANLQAQIDILVEKAGARYLLIEENNNGSISISLLDADEHLLDTKLITLTEKIIKSATTDYDNKKITYLCNDGSVIELDISDIVRHITEALSDIEEIKDEIDDIEETLSDVSGRLDDAEATLTSYGTKITDLETLTTTHTEEIEGLTQVVDGIDDDLTALTGRMDTAEATLSSVKSDMDIVKPAVAQNTTAIAELKSGKVDKDVSQYTYINPSGLVIERVDDLLVYVAENGVPNYAKLNELGFTRVKNIEEADKVDVGDLLIDMTRSA